MVFRCVCVCVGGCSRINTSVRVYAPVYAPQTQSSHILYYSTLSMLPTTPTEKITQNKTSCAGWQYRQPLANEHSFFRLVWCFVSPGCLLVVLGTCARQLKAICHWCFFIAVLCVFSSKFPIFCVCNCRWCGAVVVPSQNDWTFCSFSLFLCGWHPHFSALKPPRLGVALNVDSLQHQCMNSVAVNVHVPNKWKINYSSHTWDYLNDAHNNRLKGSFTTLHLAHSLVQVAHGRTLPNTNGLPSVRSLCDTFLGITFVSFINAMACHTHDLMHKCLYWTATSMRQPMAATVFWQFSHLRSW